MVSVIIRVCLGIANQLDLQFVLIQSSKFKIEFAHIYATDIFKNTDSSKVYSTLVAIYFGPHLVVKIKIILRVSSSSIGWNCSLRSSIVSVPALLRFFSCFRNLFEVFLTSGMVQYSVIYLCFSFGHPLSLPRTVISSQFVVHPVWPLLLMSDGRQSSVITSHPWFD